MRVTPTSSDAAAVTIGLGGGGTSPPGPDGVPSAAGLTTAPLAGAVICTPVGGVVSSAEAVAGTSSAVRSATSGSLAGTVIRGR
jgi:hypothetical protein